MNLIQCFLTNSNWYKGALRNGKPVGVLWHDTAGGNPYIQRYVQPYETDANYNQMIQLFGKNKYNNDWNHIDHESGVNAWIGKLADGTIATVQVGEWDIHAWGCGAGSAGSCNGYVNVNGVTKWVDPYWIQFEICDDGYKDEAYFKAAYKEACEFTAYICKQFGIDPNGTVRFNGVDVPTVLCHADSYNLKLGCNHSDVYLWFNKFGKTMDDVRNDVDKLIGNVTTNTTEKVSTAKPVDYSAFKKGSVVQIKNGAIYYDGKTVPSWVIAKRWIVYQTATSSRVVIDESEDGMSSIMAPIDAKYLTIISAKQNGDEEPSFELGNLDIVKIKDGVNTYANGAKMPSWVITAKLYVREIEKNSTVVVSTLQTGDVTGVVNMKDLVLIEKAQTSETAIPKEQKNEHKTEPEQKSSEVQTSISVEPPNDNMNKEPDDAQNSNNVIHNDLPAEEPSDEVYIHSSEEAQNFIVRLLNHIISFIMKLFKK